MHIHNGTVKIEFSQGLERDATGGQISNSTNVIAIITEKF